MEYLVLWAIHVDGETPKDAAANARKMRTEKGSTAQVYDVYTPDGKTPIARCDFHLRKFDEVPEPTILRFEKQTVFPLDRTMITTDNYFIRTDTFTPTVRGIALYHKGDKATLLGTFHEETGEFHQYNDLSLDLIDMQEILALAKNIEEYGFSAIFNVAPVREEDDEEEE